MQINRDDVSYTPTHIEIYEVQMTKVEGNFNINTELSKVIKPNLIFFQTHATKIHWYSHLKGVQMNDKDEKTELPIHVIAGASEYSQIKTNRNIRIGNRTDDFGGRCHLELDTFSST